MKKLKLALKTGSRWIVPVTQEHIDDSDPCNKDNCMLTRAVIALLVAVFGEGKYRVKSTNHGVVIDVKGRRLVAVFDTHTANVIYRYDETFKKTHSKARAIADVKPFQARIMVESNQALPVYEAMSEEAKKKLAKRAKERSSEHIHKPVKGGGSRRELSL